MPKKRTYLPADQRREHILEVARRQLADRGCLSLRALCTEAEISRATLYHYFGGPEAVRLALLSQLLCRLEALVAARRTLIPDELVERPPPERIEAAVRESLRGFFGAAYAHAETILATLRSRNADADADAVVRRIEAVLIGALEEDLERAQRVGLVQVGDVHLAAIALFAGLSALVEHGLSHRDTVDVDSLVDTAVRLQLFGLLVRS